jgi:hypothetical protein
MKKTLLVLIAIALVSSFAFAEAVVGGEASISGSVTLTAGYDLDDGGMGFQNDDSIVIVLPILAGDAGASGDDGVYAEIMVEDIGWEFNSDESDSLWDADEEEVALTASISATVYFNSLYLGLGEPDFEINNVDVSDDYLVDAYADALDNGGGFTLGFKNDMIDVALMVASEKDAYLGSQDDDLNAEVDDSHTTWNNDNDEDEETDDYSANKRGDMIFGVMATVMPAEGVTVPLSFFYDAANKSDLEDLMAFGMAPSVAMGDLTFDLPVDYVDYGKNGSGYELEPAVGYTVMEGFEVAGRFLYGSYDKVLVASLSDVGIGGDAPDTDSTELEIQNAVAEFGVTLTDTEAFVPGLSWMLDVSMVNMLNYLDKTSPDGYLPLEVEATASFMMGGMKPYMSAEYGFKDAEMELGLGVVFDADFTGIDNTVITLDYYNDAILDGSAYDKDGAIPAEADGDTEAGRVTLAIEFSF